MAGNKGQTSRMRGSKAPYLAQYVSGDYRRGIDRRIVFSGLPENTFTRVTLKFFRHGHALHCLLAVSSQNLTHPRNRGCFRRTRVAIVQCAVSVAASSSTGASSGTAAAVVVVSSHSIGSGLRVIPGAGTPSLRAHGTVPLPFMIVIV